MIDNKLFFSKCFLVCAVISGFLVASSQSATKPPINKPLNFTEENIERRFDDKTAIERLTLIKHNIAAIESTYKKFKSDIEEIAKVNMTIINELVYPNQPVTITLEVKASKVPNSELVITKDWLSKSPNKVIKSLDWTSKRQGRYSAQVDLTPQETGNYLVYWKCDIGGDIPEFWRNFSVIDNEWTVLIINTNANGANPPEKILHKYHLPSNLFSGHTLWALPKSAAEFVDPSRDSRQYGDDYQISLWLSNTYVNMFEKEDSKLYEESKAIQEAVFGGYRDYVRWMQFWRKPDSIMVSSMSNEVADSLRKTGYRIIGGLYADQNWADGGDYRINGWGMPARPFFMSHEDFRKCETTSPPQVIGIQQCHRQSVLCRDYNCVFSLEAGADYMMDRYSQYHRERDISKIIAAREFDFLRCFFDTQTPRKNPLFFTCCLEFAGFDWMPEMLQIQPLFIQYIAEEVSKNKLAVATPHAVSDFYRNNFNINPESVIYLPDMWAGRVITGYDRPRPPIYPDTMEMENQTYRAIFRKGETLPYVYYDYTKKWGYPYWDNPELPRGPGGYVIPNTDNRFKGVPPIYDTRNMKATVDVSDKSDHTEVQVVIDSKVAKKDIALSIWDIPREYSENLQVYSLQGATRFIPVKAPFTGNLNGILVADVQKGKNTVTLKVSSDSRNIISQDLKLNDAIFAKVFERDHDSIAYLYNPTSEKASINFTVPDGKVVKLYHHATKTDIPESLSGEATFDIEPQKPTRLQGLTANEMKAVFEQSEFFQVDVKLPYCNINKCNL